MIIILAHSNKKTTYTVFLDGFLLNDNFRRRFFSNDNTDKPSEIDDVDLIDNKINGFNWTLAKDTVFEKEAPLIKPIITNLFICVDGLSKSDFGKFWGNFIGELIKKCSTVKITQCEIRMCFVRVKNSQQIKKALSKVDYNIFKTYVESLLEKVNIYQDKKSFISMNHPSLASKLRQLNSFIVKYTQLIDSTVNESTSSISIYDVRCYVNQEILKIKEEEPNLTIRTKYSEYNSKKSLKANNAFCNITLEALQEARKIKREKKLEKKERKSKYV